MPGGSVVVSFDATGLVLGDMTAKVPGLALRHYLKDNDASDGITLLLEVLGGAAILEALLAGIRDRYRADVDVHYDGPDHWRGRITYQDVDALRGHPVYGPFIEVLPLIDRGLLVFEDGLSIQRYDFPAGTDPALMEEVKDRVVAGCESQGISCMSRITRFDVGLEEWMPLRDGQVPCGPHRTAPA